MIRNMLSFKIYGLPIVPTFIGSFLSMATMFMWYGSFFVHRFHPLMGIVEEQVTSAELGIWYPIGMALAMLQGVGIAILLKWRGWPNLWTAIKTGLTAGILFGAMVFSYPLVILPDHNIELFLINASGIITAWVLAAIAIILLRPRKTS